MSNEMPKIPKSGGAKKATDAIKKFRNQRPSDRLVNIISEYGNETNVANGKVPSLSPHINNMKIIYYTEYT